MKKFKKWIIAISLVIILSAIGLFVYKYIKINSELNYIKSGEYYIYITEENYLIEQVMDKLIEYFEQMSALECSKGFSEEKFMTWLSMNDTELFVRMYNWVNKGA